MEGSNAALDGSLTAAVQIFINEANADTPRVVQVLQDAINELKSRRSIGKTKP